MTPRRFMPAWFSRRSPPIHSSMSGFTGFFTKIGISTPRKASAMSCSKWACRRACTNPQQTYARFKCCFDVCGRCHFRSRDHPQFFVDTAQPRERFQAFTLKTAGLGARFPNAGTKDSNTKVRQFACCLHYLCLRFCGARARDQERFFAARGGW